MIKAIKHFLFSLLTAALVVTQAFGQTASILPLGVSQFFDNNGNPLSSGSVSTYIPGTLTSKTTWKNSTETIANTNPVILDAAGRAIIYGVGAYRQIVRDQNGNIIWDAVTSSYSPGGGTIATGDGDLVGTIKPWAGIIAPNQYVFAFGQELIRANFSTLMTAVTLNTFGVCTSGSPTITNIADTTSIPVGAALESTCSSPGATVLSKTSSTVVISSNALITANVGLLFFPFGNGNGSTTFNVPDLRDVVIAGRPNMGGIDRGLLTSTYYGANPAAQGALGGSQSTTIAQANLPNVTLTTSIASGQGSHTHTATTTAVVSAGAAAQSGGGLGVTGSPGAVTVAANTLPAMTGTTPTGGSGTPVSNIQPTLTLNYIIKVTPDSNSAIASGVTSLGGMTGDIICGAGMICTGNTIVSIGNLTGPAGATDNDFVLFNGNTGAVVKDSGFTIIPVTKGGTGLATLTSGRPLLGAGTSNVTFGTLSGNTTELATISGSLTGGNCVSIDGSGNLIDAGSPCGSGGGGGSGTVTAGTACNVTYYASNGTVVTGNNILCLTSNKATFTLGGTNPLTMTNAGGPYNIISFNNNSPASNFIGLFGGGSGDPNLYLSVGPGGAFNFRLNGVTFGTITSSGTSTMSLGLNGTVGGAYLTQGATSGQASVFAQAIAGNPTLFWPTGSGTLVSNAGAGILINSTTGAVSPDFAAQSNIWQGTANKIVGSDVLKQSGLIQTVAYAGTVTFDFHALYNAQITLTGNVTFANPSNVDQGQAGCITIIQDATGSRVATYGTNWTAAGGVTALTLSTSPNAKDELCYQNKGAGIVFATLNKAVTH